jgi:hypothetical protein
MASPPAITGVRSPSLLRLDLAVVERDPQPRLARGPVDLVQRFRAT